MRDKIEEVWMAFAALPQEEKLGILERLLRDSEIREDILDIAVLVEREGEPARLFSEYVNERDTIRESRGRSPELALSAVEGAGF
jgi:hypothetical protein